MGGDDVPPRASLKTVVFFCSHHTGHLNPTLALVEIFRKHGVATHYFAPAECRLIIERSGAVFHPHGGLKELALEQVEQLGCTPSTGLRNEFFFEQILPVTVALMKSGLRERVAALEPDLLVADTSCYWGMLVAQLLHVPCVSSCSCSVLAPQEKDAIFSFLRKIDFIQKSTRWIDTEYNIQYDPTDSFFNLTEFTVIWSLEEFAGCSAAMGSSSNGTVDFSSFFRFWGASMPADYVNSSPLDVRDDVFETVRRAKEAPNSLVVYCSMGTVFGQEPWTRSPTETRAGSLQGQGQGEGDMLHVFFQRVFAALRDRPGVTCVLSCGKRRTVESLGNVPSNFIVRQHVNQKQLLKLADVFITHGGNNSLHEALFAATPLLVVPLWGDQHLNARHVVDKALGTAIFSPFAPRPVKDMEHVTPEAISRGVHLIAVERKAEFAAACRGMQLRLREKHAFLHSSAIGELETFVRRWQEGRKATT